MKFGLFFLLLLAFNVNAIVYRSVDESGNVIYSDTLAPVKGGEEIEINVTPGYTPVSPPVIEEIEETESEASELEEPSYQISIVSPEYNQSIWGNTETVTVEVAIEPELSQERGDMIQFQLDGKKVGNAQSSTSFFLTNIERGSHIIIASVIDKAGKVLKRSRSVLFHLHRRSLINNPPKVNPNINLSPPKPA